MEPTTKANEIIKKGLALLPDEAKAEWKAQASGVFIDEAIDGALKVLTGADADSLDKEKEAMLNAYAVQEANRMASTLWRLQLLPEDLEKEYRELPTMTEVAAKYNFFLDERNKRADELTKQGNELQSEKRELEIFMGVVNGVPAEESEARYEQFKNAQQQAMVGAQ